MFEKIIDYLNNNPLAGIIIVLVIIGLYLYFLNRNCTLSSDNLEHAAGNVGTGAVVNTNPNMSPIFKQMVDLRKKINFKCTLTVKEKNASGTETNVNKDFYLANIEMPICSTFTCGVETPTHANCSFKLGKDCFDTALVLIPVDEINTGLADYLSDLEMSSAVCNYTSKLKCQNKALSDKTPFAECDVQLPSCTYNRFYIHDFGITDVTPVEVTNEKRYEFAGTSVPGKNNSIKNTTINQQVTYDGTGIPILCGDSRPEGKSNSEFYSVVAIEKVIPPTSAIVMTDAPPSITLKLAMNTQITIPGKDKNGSEIFIPCPLCCPMACTTAQCQNGTCPSVGAQKTYISVCDDAMVKDFIDEKNNKTYKRICLSGDIAKAIEFTPLIVQ